MIRLLSFLIDLFKKNTTSGKVNNTERDFLIKFEQFISDLDNEFPDGDYGKCYFKLLNGTECQGWIYEVNENTFEYHDSGPWARKEPYFFNIADINTNTFSYWDDEIKKWTEYYLPDKLANRNRPKRRPT